VCSRPLGSSAEKALEALLVLRLACKHQRCVRSLPFTFSEAFERGNPGS